MSTATLSYFEIASNLPPSTDVTFHDVSWEEYEQLIEELGEARGRRVSYNDGTLNIMTLSSGEELTIHQLRDDEYFRFENSLALPVLSGRVLTDFLARLSTDGESQTLVAFDEWLQSRER